MALLMRWRGPG